MATPYLAPSAVIGLGEWGRHVALGVEEALRARSPELARACPVLALRGDEPNAAELIRAHLRASRLAEVMRALEQAGLMRLDPTISLPTHLYLVSSLADDPDLAALRRVSDLARQAAVDIKAPATLAAVVDLAGAEDLPADGGRFPLYLMEPVTSHGLVIAPQEYREAAVELLVAAVQPGGSDILAEGRGLGTVGIAWLDWAPAELGGHLARRLGREALTRCLEVTDPSPQFRSALKETAAWRAQVAAERVPALLKGLPFRCSETSPALLEPERQPPGRGRGAAYLKRCLNVLQRRAARWEKVLERNARARADVEAGALERTAEAALTAGPDGLSRLRLLAESLGREAVRRLESLPDRGEMPPVARRLRQLEQAEALPRPARAAAVLGALFLVILLIWRVAHGEWSTLLKWGALLATVGLGYAWCRLWRVRRASHAAWRALGERTVALARAALLDQLERLDRAQEERCALLCANLTAASARLREHCRAEQPSGHQPLATALHGPLVEGEAIDQVYRELRPLAAEVAAELAGAGCLRLWRDAEALLEKARETAERSLAGRLSPGPAQLAARAYTDRLAARLEEAVRRLLDWSQPLLAPLQPLPEGRRWLLWPAGLPCPPVPGEVAVLAGSLSCVAALTVVGGLSAGIIRRPGQNRGEDSA